jgi:hypothetical protein
VLARPESRTRSRRSGRRRVVARVTRKAAISAAAVTAVKIAASAKDKHQCRSRNEMNELHQINLPFGD